MPDFEAIVKIYQKNHDMQSVMGLLYGGQTYEYNYHYCTFDFDSLKITLIEEVDFYQFV